MAENDVSTELYVDIMKHLRLAPEHHVGCLAHKDVVTKRIISFYLTMRVFQVLDKKNESFKTKKKQGKKLVKKAKLL